MALMKILLNQDALGDQKSQLNLVVMIRVAMMGVHLKDDRLMIHLMKDDRLMIHLMKDDRLMDDLNSLADLNYRDALPCDYSLISINI
jgi:hypothetical protein